jgi:phosphate transport system protein
MVQECLDAYVARNASLAQAIIGRDDKLDRQYRKLFEETIAEMRDDSYIRRATYLLWAGHNLERIGDRATNIAERIIYMVTGRFALNVTVTG